ncbi:MAG: STAS domain-containing protein [Anaerovibrio sp.]|uniref:STAS domain-containing protein n=1 Tax=uncultured Anaerovibrio sp. TaxID=361586 RepID=UPI0025E64B23|nr:STAS domain-containing protein [uncultured Anaerovibrio sp.]MBQ3853372.1 STAS domain-containing protein [Anaerovibrio sp.]
MRYDNSEGVLTIFLKGDMDALNATDIQQEIGEILKTQKGTSLIFDARELEYISSAGLRVILTIQKELGSKISVINLSEELLEIFKMAGFQYLMELKGV